MNRLALLKHLKREGCILFREGKRHTIYINPETKTTSTVPRHREIDDKLAHKICRDLGVTAPGKQK